MTNSINQLRMNLLDVNLFQTSKFNKIAVDELLDESLNLKEGDFNGGIVIEENDKNITNYDEYMKYCLQNAVSQYNTNPSYTFVSTAKNLSEQDVRPVHIGKALDTYLQ